MPSTPSNRGEIRDAKTHSMALQRARPPYRKGRPYLGSRADAARWLADLLRCQIMDGVFGGISAPCAVLPDEMALAREYGLSRNAVREALGRLREEGLVQRSPGIGTLVTGAKLRMRLDRLEGLAESFGGHALVVDNTVRAVREARANPWVAQRLGLQEGAPVTFIERLRSVGGIPLSLDTSYLRIEVLPAVSASELETTDVFHLLEQRLGVTLGWAEITLEAVTADSATSELLQLPQGSPLLLLHRLTYLQDTTPFDLEVIRYRGDRFRLNATLPRHGNIAHTQETNGHE